MQVELSSLDAGILSGALLMHWGVPFSRVFKRPILEKEQAVLDALSDRLAAFRENLVPFEKCIFGLFQFTKSEIVLIYAVLNDCLSECDGDTTELRIHLHSESGDDVQELLNRFIL